MFSFFNCFSFDLVYKDLEREAVDKMKVLQVIRFYEDFSLNFSVRYFFPKNQLTKVEGHSLKEIERTKQLQNVELQMEYEKRRALTEVIDLLRIFCRNKRSFFLRMKKIESMIDIDSKTSFVLLFSFELTFE